MFEVPGSNPTRFDCYIIENKVFENSKSQCYRILMVYVLSILHCRTNGGQISRPAVGRIDTALSILSMVVWDYRIDHRIMGAKI